MRGEITVAVASEQGKLLTPEEVAERLSVKAKTVREWLRAGRLVGVKAGRLWRVPEGSLASFLLDGAKEQQ